MKKGLISLFLQKDGFTKGALRRFLSFRSITEAIELFLINHYQLGASLGVMIMDRGLGLVVKEYLLEEGSQYLDREIYEAKRYDCLDHRHQSRQQQEVSTQSLLKAIQHTRHQSQNSLALIEIYTDLLNSKLPDPSLRAYVSHIQDAVRALKTHLQTMTSDQQQEQLNLAEHDLRSLVEASVQELKPWLDRKHISMNYPAVSTMLSVDAWKLKQVFDNLLHNALHFSPDQGSINCNWEVFRHEVLIEIWDEGPGLSDLDLQNLFTPYYSHRPNGTGLGLVIAQRIIRSHRGRLWAANRSGSGAKFSFTLPR